MATPDDDRDGRLSGPAHTPVNGAADQDPARPVGQRPPESIGPSDNNMILIKRHTLRN